MLGDPSSGKTWSARVEGETVFTSTGGKERASVCSSPEAARAKVVKDTWVKLKAGFVLLSAQDAPGVAAMLRFAGKGFSWLGRAAVCATEGDDSFFAVCHLGGQNLVRRVEPDATLTEVAVLPGDRMVRSMSWRDGVLYADADGQVLRIDTRTGAVTELTDVRFNLGGSLQLAGDLATWHDGRDVVVTELSSGQVVWQRPVEAGRWQGHTSMLALAVSTTHVAYSNDADTIHVVDLNDGSETILDKPVPELTDELWLTEDGRLFTAGPYTSVTRYDLREAQQDWRLPCPPHPADVTMDRARTRLAVLYRQGTAVQVIDAATTTMRAEFVPDYVIRAGACTFTRTGLALSTDYGCLGRYPLATDDV